MNMTTTTSEMNISNGENLDVSHGTLWAWGCNDYGQLGLNDNDNRSFHNQVGVMNDWRDITCGASYTVAIKKDGTLWAWGYNDDGQLGLGDTNDRHSPTQVGDMNDWSKVACGGEHTVAIRS
jgi:alpha-tubulin suppressor-like RCC1 family protein